MGFKKMRPRRKVCYFKKNHIKFIKISPRSATGTSAKYQRELAKAIKNARFMGLLPEAGQR